MIEQCGLPGAEESGQDDDRDLLRFRARLTHRATSLTPTRAPARVPAHVRGWDAAPGYEPWKTRRSERLSAALALRHPGEGISSRSGLRRSARADLPALHVQLTRMAMEDPALAEVWNGCPREPREMVRRNLFANLTFGHYLLFYEWGEVPEEELLEYARTLLRRPLFQRYWKPLVAPRSASHPTAMRDGSSGSSSGPSTRPSSTAPPARRDERVMTSAS
ncbi:DUF6082 family protein [Streptomyces sp. NPDC006624]|uniref:DUF6082 family protein n=1 Tax=Streptomyces sp. NPDC006624 TaxID=3154892 RepID=UPI0033A27F1C